jgi:hypothetical protein
VILSNEKLQQVESYLNSSENYHGLDHVFESLVADVVHIRILVLKNDEAGYYKKWREILHKSAEAQVFIKVRLLHFLDNNHS